MPFLDIMAKREPDLVIGDPAAPYLRRWHLIPRNENFNVYLHHILRSDDDRAMHDHPWDNTSFLLYGGYDEVTPAGVVKRVQGDMIQRKAEWLHRLVMEPGRRCVSLFITGPKVRNWGFQCPHGWVHWEQFVDPNNRGLAGPGCGQ